MDGLRVQAKRYMRLLGEGGVPLGLWEILGIASVVSCFFGGRRVLPAGYKEHLRRRLASAVKGNGGLLEKDGFIEGLGQVPEIDKFVLRTWCRCIRLKSRDCKGWLGWRLVRRECMRGQDSRTWQNDSEESSTEFEASPSDGEESWSDLLPEEWE